MGVLVALVWGVLVWRYVGVLVVLVWGVLGW